MVKLSSMELAIRNSEFSTNHKPSKRKHMKDNTVLMKFEATWCIPCKNLDKTMIKVEIPFEVQYFDASEHPEVFTEFKVKNVPTLILMKDGIEVNRTVGMLNETQLKEFLKIS